MIVISLSDVPPKVRGDISKWLFEISTGVFVGNLSARVRDRLWERICLHSGNGRATMVYSAEGEQKLAFKTYNTTWEPVDYDGIRLMRHPLPGRKSDEPGKEILSMVETRLLQRRIKAKTLRDKYVVVDIETTGLAVLEDEIIEVAAVLVEEGVVKQEYTALIKTDQKIPKGITALTGITQEEIEEKGVSIKKALHELISLVGECTLITYNGTFDRAFLQRACEKNGIKSIRNRVVDVLTMARRKLSDVKDYKLATVAKALGIERQQPHRALEDCHLTHLVYAKLNEK